MRFFSTGNQMREAERHTIQEIGLPSMVLMERAALQIVEKLELGSLSESSKVLVVCGSGNNGGDGYAVARLLHLKGYCVEICFVGNEDSRTEENRKQKEIVDYYNIPLVESVDEKEYTIIIDAIFGIGVTRDIEGEYYDVISKLNQMKGLKVAIDVPSGIHATTGRVMGIAVKADITVAIAFEKRGLVLYPGCEYAGDVLEADIGVDTITKFPEHEVVSYGYDLEDLRLYFPKRKANSHKGDYGKVLLIVGSKGMSGASYLCAKAVYEVGAGLVQIYTTEDNRVILQESLPEAIVTTYNEYDEAQLEGLLNWADVIGIGSGLGKSETSVEIVKDTMKKAECPCVVDADGLNIIAEHMEWLNDRKQEVILTPHMKEMSRLLKCSVNDLAEERVQILTEFVSKYAVTCVLKDARTLVATPGRDLYINISGDSAMAKAGAGDVLTGIITGIAAQHIESHEAASMGAYIHGIAGIVARDNKGRYSVLASDIIDGIGEVLKKL